MFCTFHIAGCTICNIKLFLNTLRVVQPAMYLKTICVAVYTTCCSGVVIIIRIEVETFNYKTNMITTITPQQQVCQSAT